MTDPRPARQLAVVTCMDCRIDVGAVIGLETGDAHVLRNAGGRVTEDVVRSLVISTQLLGVTEVVVMQHTRCGLFGVTDEELRSRTSTDIEFLAIADHEAALRADVARVIGGEGLGSVSRVTGLLYDVETSQVAGVVSWPAHAEATPGKHAFATLER